MSVPTATVHLVGAGPGDPLLLTRRASALLGLADTVVADRRSADAIVALAPIAAERVFVGRADGHPAWSTDEIADLLAERARAGRCVVRLKSGDPFVCSRGAEEVAALEGRGIRCVITPGVSAATAVPLAAGLARGATVTVASGDADPQASAVPWGTLADPAASLVVLTGRAQQGRIAAELLAAGRMAHAPVSIVHAAGRPGTRVVATTLAALGSRRLPPPAAFVVGPEPETVGAHP